MTKKIVIPYFHKGLKYITPLLFGTGAYFIFKDHLIWGILLLMVSYIVLSTRYITEINLKDKFYKDYLFFLGFHFSEEYNKFNQVDRIVVTKGDYAQMINTRSSSRQLDWVDYTATLVFDDESTLNLLTKNEKDDLLLGLKEFAEFLQVGVEDRTTKHHFWIDLNKIGVS